MNINKYIQEGFGNFGDDEKEGDEPEVSNDDAIKNVYRSYKLKKLYAKIYSLNNYLYRFSGINNDKFDTYKADLDKAIEFFNTIIDNITIYKDKIDEVIDTFEKYLINTSEGIDKLIKQEYKKSEREDKAKVKKREKKKEKPSSEYDIVKQYLNK